MDALRLAVLVSGRGTNLQAILDAIESGALTAEVVAVLSDRADPPAFRWAREKGIPTVFVDPGRFSSRENYDAALAREVRCFQADTVALAGFMRVLTPVFLNAFPGRVVNIHPALLPAFPGLNAQRQALVHGVRFSGCTVHFVDAGVDTGPIILQAVVPVYQDDTPETLAARILAKEHLTYPAALQLLAEGRLRIAGRRVFINRDGRTPRRPRDCVEEWEEIKDWRKEALPFE
ncbi:MAG: phosphoribosylglycinamide formyltransferase [Bacillota bacterium]|jgi:phosphoribosylglycinamide formyltransferase-1|nr:phosphoribosylglycinamide formyltransferase [Bacillota bacterium]